MRLQNPFATCRKLQALLFLAYAPESHKKSLVSRILAAKIQMPADGAERRRREQSLHGKRAPLRQLRTSEQAGDRRLLVER